MIEQIIITIIAVGLTTGLLVWSWVLVLIQENKIKTLKQHIKEQDITIENCEKLCTYDIRKLLEENEKLKFQINNLQSLRVLAREARARLNAENEKLSKEIIQYSKIQQIVKELHEEIYNKEEL